MAMSGKAGKPHWSQVLKGYTKILINNQLVHITENTVLYSIETKQAKWCEIVPVLGFIPQFEIDKHKVE